MPIFLPKKEHFDPFLFVLLIYKSVQKIRKIERVVSEKNERTDGRTNRRTDERTDERTEVKS